MAGFHVTGVDLKEQPRDAGDVFVRGDALEFVRAHGSEYDVIHASPPCQRFSGALNLWGTARRGGHPNLVEETRAALRPLGVPYAIENVVGAPLLNPVMLCGAMFGLRTYRHRLFESNVLLFQPEHPRHTAPVVKMGRAPKEGDYINPVGHFSGVSYVRRVMECGWMKQAELAQAIPPAYTMYIGEQLMSFAGEEAA